MSGNPQLDTQIITAIFSVMTGVMTAAVMAPVLKASGQAYGGSYLQATSDGTVTLLNAGKCELMVTCEFSGYLGSATVPIQALSSTTKEIYLGGGTDGSTGNRRAVCNVSLTQAGGLVATKDGADATSQATWTIYAR